MKKKMNQMIDKLLGKKKEEPKKKLSAEEERRAVLAKEKEQASKKGEPWVGVLDTKVNPDNIKNGFFELLAASTRPKTRPSLRRISGWCSRPLARTVTV